MTHFNTCNICHISYDTCMSYDVVTPSAWSYVTYIHLSPVCELLLASNPLLFLQS